MADQKKKVSGDKKNTSQPFGNNYAPSNPFDESTVWDEVPVEQPIAASPPAMQTERPSSSAGNPLLLKGLLAGGLVLLVLVLLGWLLLGGDDRPPSLAAAPTAPVPTQPAAPVPAPNASAARAPSAEVAVERPPEATPPVQGAEQGVAADGEKAVKPDEKKTDGKQEKSKDALPDDVTAWKKEHYYLARQRNDPKLLDAVKHLGDNFQGNVRIAEGLTDLLKKLPPTSSSETGSAAETPSRNPEDYTRLVGNIVAALGKNGSGAARATLEQILSGAFATDDDTIAVEVALEALAAHSCEENEALLLRAVTAPEALRPANRQGVWTAKDLRARAVDLIRPVASAGFRLKLAEAVASHVSQFDASDPIRDFLLAPDPMNCGAQTILYEQSGLSQELKRRLEKSMTDYGSHAVAYWLGLMEKAPEEVPEKTAAPSEAAPSGESKSPSGLDLLREREKKIQEERERERVRKIQEMAEAERTRIAQEEAERERQRKTQEEADRKRAAEDAQNEQARRIKAAQESSRRKQVEEMRLEREMMERRGAEDAARAKAANEAIWKQEEIDRREQQKKEDAEAIQAMEVYRKRNEAQLQKARQQPQDAARQPMPQRSGQTGATSELKSFLFVEPPEMAAMSNLESWLAEHLWSEKFRAAVDLQLEKLSSLNSQSHLVLLASTLPLDSTRAALARVFRKHWDEGPKSLENEGWLDRLTTDPGLLVLVKMNPRKEPKVNRTLPGGRPPDVPELAPESGSGRSSARAAKLAEARRQAEQKKEQEEQAKLDWMSVSSKLVQFWCQRLYGLALIRQKKASAANHPLDGSTPKPPENLDVEPYAKIVASYHLDWPEQLPPDLTSAKPGVLKVHYLRTECRGKPKKTVAFYQRQTRVKPADYQSIGHKLWMDTLRPSVQSGTRKSLDVLIARADGQSLETAVDDEETDLIVEILSIEIKDPDK